MSKLLKCFIISFIFAVGFAARSYALNVDLGAEHGVELDKASYAIRYAFYKATGTAWPKSEYEDRKKFLENWYDGIEQEQQLAQQQQKQQEEMEKQEQEQKKQEKRQEQEKIKRRQELKEREKKQERERQKRFDDKIRDRQRRIDEFRRNQR